MGSEGAPQPALELRPFSRSVSETALRIDENMPRPGDHHNYHDDDDKRTWIYLSGSLG